MTSPTKHAGSGQQGTRSVLAFIVLGVVAVVAIGIGAVAVLTGADDAKPNHPPAAWLDREGLRQFVSQAG